MRSASSRANATLAFLRKNKLTEDYVGSMSEANCNSDFSKANFVSETLSLNPPKSLCYIV